MKLISIFFLGIFLGSIAHAEVPSDALKMLAQLPGQELSVEFVVAKAYATADSLRAIQSRSLANEADYWQAMAPLSTQMSLSGSYSKNDNPHSTIFEQRSSQQWALGVAKYWSTGTQVGLELNETKSILDPQNTFQNPNQTGLKASLSQNLWRDGFGTMTRHQVKAGRLLSQVNELNVDESVQKWALDLIKVYYGAWLAKSQFKVAEQSHKRRERLFKITQLKRQRGTAEHPDLLQMESAMLASLASEHQATQDLQGIWRELVTNLKLPANWLEIPAAEIPLALDHPYEDALHRCQTRTQQSGIQDRESIQQKIWRARTEASLHALQAAQNGYSPRLSLEGSFASIGITGEFDQRSQDALSGRFPQWSVGLQLKMPMEWYAEKSQLARAAAQYQENTKLLSKVQADQETSWINFCARLVTLNNNREILEKSVGILSERVSLEERRFELGLSTPAAAILAGDDFSQGDFQLNQTRVNLNQVAWEIVQLDNGLEPYLRSALNSFDHIQF